MKEYLAEVMLSTIVAAGVTLLFYIVGVDKSWQDASTTFGTCFLVSFAIGLWNRYKKNKQ